MDILLAIAVTLGAVGILIMIAANIVMEIVGRTTAESDLIFYTGVCLTLIGVTLACVAGLAIMWMGVMK